MENVKSKDVKVRAHGFSLNIIRLVNAFPRQVGYKTIGDQLIRAATSIGANLIEAQAASSRRDFTNCYSIALKSANETKYWLSLLERYHPCTKMR